MNDPDLLSVLWFSAFVGSVIFMVAYIINILARIADALEDIAASNHEIEEDDESEAWKK